MIQTKAFEPTVGRKKASDGYTGMLREAYEYFAESNIQMISGFPEILAEDGLFEAYKTKLTEGLTSDEAEQLEQIMENSRLDLLRESSISQLAPIAGLSMPTVRKMWIRTAMKNAIPTETAKLPSFTISYMLPYLRDPDGTKHMLPEALRDLNNTLAEKARLTQDWINAPAENFDLLGASGGSLTANDAVDPIFYLDTVKVEVANDSATEQIEVPANLKLTLQGQIYGQITFQNRKTVPETITETIFGTVDCTTGKMTLTSLKGTVKAFKIKGWFSSENNTKGQSVSFDIQKKDVRIGTGTHLNATLPIEWLQDNLALYNIDGTVEVVDIMSNVVAQKLDQEIRHFFEKSFDASGTPFVGQFDVKPAAGFAGSPTDWRRELKTVIEYWATKMKQLTAFSQGYFVVYGNRLDVNLIPDINWQFKSIQGERGGVTVDYDLGAVTYNNAFQIVATDNCPQGELRMFFVPTDNEHMTYKYYPYTFNVEKGYLDPQSPLLPAIMMTKRQTYEELVPCQCAIKILHNDGSLITSYSL